MEPGIRKLMESRFGHDFSKVRIHSDRDSAASAQWHNALAYTIGEEVVFSGERYQPSNESGRSLLAHELTHVVQQRRHGVRFQARRPSKDAEDDAGEREAQQVETTPPAAQLTDTRVKTLPEHRAMLDSLKEYVNGVPGQLSTLIQKGIEGAPWLTLENPNVQSAFRVLDQLAADMNAEQLVFRFDLPKENLDEAGGMYVPSTDTIRLPPFAPDNPRERASATVYLLHEYVHVIQDREAESLFAQQRSARIETYDEQLGRETQAKREQTYFGEILRAVIRNAGYLPTYMSSGTPAGLIRFDESSEYLYDFEQERSAAAPQGRADATERIRANMATAYSDKLPPEGSDIKTYAIEIDAGNHALLYWDLAEIPTPRDLGEIPPALADIDQLRAHLSRTVSQLAEFKLLFNHSGSPLRGIYFNVVYKEKHLATFGLQHEKPIP